MPARPVPHRRKSPRRRALYLGHVQGVLWAIGNGLTTGPLVIYFAMDLGARSRDIGWILAMPAFVSLLRIGAPRLFEALGSLRAGAIVFLSAAYVLLGGLPVVAMGLVGTRPIAGLIVLLSLHQLLESIGMVAVWAWLGNIVPARIRGRYFAARQRLQVAALIPTLLAGALFADAWRHSAPPGVAGLMGYMVPMGVGAALLLLSVVALYFMPHLGDAELAAAPGPSIVGSVASNGPYMRLLIAGCWISFFNGMTQTAQNTFPKVLGVDIMPLAIMRIAMQLGQIALSPTVGRMSDRYGNRPVLAICQTIVALGPLFFLLATPEQPYWMAGAWITWSAFVGLNICVPALIIKLSPFRRSAGNIAAYFALTGIAYAAGTLQGARLLDEFRYTFYRVWSIDLDHYGYMFYIGWVTRSLGALLLLGINEPGAWRLRDILGLGRKQPAEPQRSSPWD